MDLCAPPVNDITYANGQTGAISGLVTSVRREAISGGKLPIAHRLDIANFGGSFFLRCGLNESEH